MRSFPNLIPLLLTAAVGCSGSTFQGQSGKAAEKSGRQPDDATSTDAKANKTGGSDDETPLGSSAESDETSECLETKGGEYRFLLVFDESSSMEDSDPSNVRRQGALTFIDQLARAVGKSNGLKVKVGVVAFSRESRNVSGGWKAMSSDAKAAIVADVQRATDPGDLGGGTNYLAALSVVTPFFEKVSDKAKSFVVFLSDGEPNRFGGGFSGTGDMEDQIHAQVDQLVGRHDIAMITIASGSDISAKGTEILRKMAKPTSGEHRGLYRRAATGSELQSVWRSLLKDSTGCGDDD